MARDTEKIKERQKAWYQSNKKKILAKMAKQRKLAKQEKKYKMYLQLKKEFETNETNI